MELGLCIEMAYTNDPFETRLAKAAAAGFKNVEMWFVDMTFKGTPDELAALAHKHGVRITNTVVGAPDGSVGGGLTNPANRDQWLDRARSSIAFTKEAGIPATIVCTGNDVPGMTDEAMMASVIDGLKPTVEIAEEAGVTLLLEALNTRHDHQGYWLSSSDRSAEICRRLGSDRMKLLFDCYHMQISEGDLVSHIEANIDVIGHFHAAGVPGRHELDSGELNYPFVLQRIAALGYQDVFALEYAPSADHDASVRRMFEHLYPCCG